MGGSVGQVVAFAAVAVATVATAGLAAPIGAAVLGAEVAATTIIGSATIGSVTGGAIIGAGIGAVSGAAQAALVGEDIFQGMYEGVAVGAISGAAGLLGAGVASEVAGAAGLDPGLTKAVTEAGKGATANATGAAVQDQNVGEWAAMGAISGAATPLVTAGLGGVGVTGDVGKLAGSTIGGALSGAGSAAVSGGDVGTAALTGAGMGLVSGVAKPYIEDVMSSLTGGGTTTGATQGAATPVSSGIEGLTPQEISELTTLLSAEVPTAAGAGEQFVEEAYQALFGRAADPEGRAYYAAQIEAGVPREQVLQNMSYGAQGEDVSRAAGFDIGTFREGMTPSEYALASVAGDMGGQDVEVVGDYVTGEGPDVEVVDGGYETTSKGGPDVVEDVEANLAEERARAGDEVARGAKEVGDVVREVVTRPLDQQPSKTTVPTFGTGLSKTDREMLSLTGIDGTKGVGGTKGTGGLSDFGFTPTGAGGGGPSTLTGDLVSASYSPDTGAPTFGTSTTFQPTTQSVSGGGPGTGTTSTTPTTSTRPTTTKEKETVRISPIVIDPTVSPLVRALRAAPTPVRSAGLDPATSGVLLGKYGKKDQVWNEATLRLADALGIR